MSDEIELKYLLLKALDYKRAISTQALVFAHFFLKNCFNFMRRSAVNDMAEQNKEKTNEIKEEIKSETPAEKGEEDMSVVFINNL